jgi:hypothetical protein
MNAVCAGLNNPVQETAESSGYLWFAGLFRRYLWVVVGVVGPAGLINT